MCPKILQATKGMSTCSHVDRERWQRQAAFIQGVGDWGMRLGHACTPLTLCPGPFTHPIDCQLQINYAEDWESRRENGEGRRERGKEAGSWVYLHFGCGFRSASPFGSASASTCRLLLWLSLSSEKCCKMNAKWKPKANGDNNWIHLDSIVCLPLLSSSPSISFVFSAFRLIYHNCNRQLRKQQQR